MSALFRRLERSNAFCNRRKDSVGVVSLEFDHDIEVARDDECVDNPVSLTERSTHSFGHSSRGADQCVCVSHSLVGTSSANK